MDDSREVCNCKNISIKEIKEAIKTKGANTLGKIQEQTNAGTECRFCIFSEGDFGKIKKEIYLKDILNKIKEEENNG